MLWEIQEKVTMYKSKAAAITKQGNFHILTFFFFFNGLHFSWEVCSWIQGLIFFFLKSILWILLLGKGEHSDSLT